MKAQRDDEEYGEDTTVVLDEDYYDRLGKEAEQSVEPDQAEVQSEEQDCTDKDFVFLT